MVRAVAKLLIVAAILLATPAATASFSTKGASPVIGGWPLLPQLHCEVLFDKAESHRCDISGPGREVTHMRARIVGQANVRAYLTDEGVPVPITRGILECTKSCVIPLAGPLHSSRFNLLVLVDGAPNSFVSVDIESGTGDQIL